MQKSLAWLGTVVLTLCAWAAGAHAQAPAGQVVVVAEPAVIGVDPATGAAFADLIRGELARQSGWTVIPRSATPQIACGDAGCGQQIAQQTGAGGAVVLSMSQLGQKVVVNVTFVWVDGRVLFSDRVSAATPEDLDPLSKRTAVAVATGKPIGETATVTTVTDEEAKPPKRKQALFTEGIRFGALIPVADAYGGAGPMSDIGFIGMFEMPRFAVDLAFDIFFPFNGDADVGAGGVGFNLGAKYFFDESDNGYFLSGGFGYRAMAVDQGNLNDDGAGGFGFYGGGGIVFLRTSDLHVVAEVRYDVNTFKFDLPEGSNAAHGISATLGFTYKGFGRRWLW